MCVGGGLEGSFKIVNFSVNAFLYLNFKVFFCYLSLLFCRLFWLCTHRFKHGTKPREKRRILLARTVVSGLILVVAEHRAAPWTLDPEWCCSQAAVPPAQASVICACSISSRPSDHTRKGSSELKKDYRWGLAIIWNSLFISRSYKGTIFLKERDPLWENMYRTF